MSFFSNLSSLFSDQKRRSGPKPPAPKPKKAKVVSPPPQPLKSAPPTPPLQAQRQVVKPAPASASTPAPLDHQTAADIENALREAKAKAREIIVEAKGEALSLRSKAEREARDLAKKLEDQQRSLDLKLDKIDSRLEQMDRKEADVERERQAAETLKAELEKTKVKVMTELESVATLTHDEAKKILFERLEQRMTKEMALFIRQREEEAKTEAEERVQEILIDAMRHGATDYVPEYTVSTIQLPSEDAKGKIIGKGGRNIHAIERETGADLDLDASPTEVRISCFDPVRREIARISLERLIKDGRIQPTRVEEVVAKVKTEIDKIMFEAGKKLCHDIGIYNLPLDLIKMLGRFKFRFSYGQNLIAHTLEETKIGIKLAHELKADVNVVKLGCLLHDIGKVSEETEGSHVELGVAIAKKYGMPQAVIDCIAQHHEDEEFTGPEQMIVYIADAISGARPGARYENYDEYVKRLQTLEEIANSYPGVRQSFAIQAGREVRVLLDPEATKDDDVKVLAGKIRDDIKAKMTYPGTVTVTVLRELRGQQVAT